MSDIQGESALASSGSDNGVGPDYGAPPLIEERTARDQRPEVAVAAAFAGGLLLAILLRRIRSRDDG